MSLNMRTTAVIAVAAVLGVGLSIAYFSRDDVVTGLSAPDSDPAVEDEMAAAMPPPETFNPVFEPCAHCHQVGDGARHTSGPQLNGIIGDPAAARDYPYSAAMQASGLTWDEATLVRFLVEPYEMVPGTRMLFEGMPREEAERIVDYLRAVEADSSPSPG